MIDAVIRWSLHNRLVVLAAALVLLVWGSIETSRAPVDVFPDLTAPTVTVLAEAHGMAPEEVETLVSFPLETALNGAAGVRRIRSSSAAGISIVWVEFDWGTDIMQARQIVAEKVQLVTPNLPPQVDPPILGPVTSIMGEVMFVAVRAEGHEPMQLRTLVDWTIRPRLLAVSGVSQVIPIGGERKTLRVEIDADRALDRRVSLRRIADVVAAANENAAAGFAQRGPQEQVVRAVGRVQTPQDLSAAVIEVVDAYPVTLGEVARVRWAPGVKRGEGSFGAAPAIVIGIQKQPGANTLTLTARIDTVLDELALSLPETITIERDGFRQAAFIDRAVDNVSTALRDGAILVVVIVLVFLASGRATVVTALAIPLSLLCTVVCLRWYGAEINTMTLGGMAIAVGALVDDAIIDTENVVRRLRENVLLPPERRRAAVVVVFDASKEIRSSIVFATLIIALVFVPVFFLHGVEGRLLAPLGVAYVVALLASLVVALTVTPVLCVLLLPHARVVTQGRTPWVVRVVRRAYAPVLRACLGRWRPLSAICLGLLGLAVVGLGSTGRVFLPEFNEGALTVSVVTQPGTSLQQSDQLGNWVEKILLAQPEVAATTRRTGRAELDEHAQGVHAAEIDVRLHDAAAGDTRDREAFLTAVREQVSAVPGTNVVIGQPISHRIDHMLSGTRANVAIKIFGSRLDELQRIAVTVKARIESIDGVVDLMIEQPPDVPGVVVRFDRAALADYGLTVREAARTVEAAVAGLTVSKVIRGNLTHDIVVRLGDGQAPPDALADVRILTDSGAHIPLRAVAQIVRDAGPSTVSRENAERKVVVACNVAGRDLGTVVTEIQLAVDGEIALPPGYRVEYGGQFQSAQRATQTLVIVGAGVVLGIFVLLVAALASVRDAVLVLLNLPLALIGGVAALYYGAGVLSVASLVGFITLLGIATRNGIMLVSHIAHLREREGVDDARVAVERGAQERVVPILMTALATAGGLLPLVMAAGEPGSEIQAPMAAVILAGLASATALNMIVIPALYLRFGRYRQRP